MTKSKATKLQKAWNEIAEYMNSQDELTFFINPWGPDGSQRYTLNTIIEYPDGSFKYKHHFVADKERIDK